MNESAAAQETEQAETVRAVYEVEVEVEPDAPIPTEADIIDGIVAKCPGVKSVVVNRS